MKSLKDAGSIAGIAVVLFLGCVSESRAQQFPVNVTPAQLTFNATVNGAAVGSQSLNVSSTTGSNTTFTATALSGGNWLTVSPTAGTTPQVLSISVNPSALAAGSYAGFITVASGGGSVTVPIVLNVNFFGTPPLLATPSGIFFGFLPGSTTPQIQAISIAGAAGTAFTATASTSNGGNFLTISPNSGTLPATLNVSVNPTNLTTGFYFGAIAVNPPNSAGLIIPVQVNVGVQSAINISPQRLTFGYQTGTSTPAPQTLFLTTTEAPIGFTASVNTSACVGNWVSLVPSSGIAPGTLTVQVDPTGLPPETCNGTIYISAPGAANPAIMIPVSLLVSKDPVLQVPATLPVIQYQTGTATPGPVTVQVTTSSSTPLNFTVSTSPAPGSPDFLTASPNSGTTPQTVTFSVNPSALTGLAPNSYAENVTFSSPGSAIPIQFITVPLVVSSTPVLTISQQSINFNFQVGQASPPSQVFTVSSTGAPLPFSIFPSSTTCPGFLTATTSAGSTAIQSGQPAQVTVGVDTTGLKAGQTCYGNVLILIPGSTAPVLNVPVTLNVSSAAALTFSPAAINVAAVAGSTAVQIPIAVTSTDGSTALNFSATSATNPSGGSWLSIASASGSSPGNISVTVDPSNLTPGIYTGVITVGKQSIPVVLTVTSGPITAAPTSLTFSQVNNSTAPASQTIQITGVPQGATVMATGTVQSGASWLTATASGGTVTVAVNSGTLLPGTYSGVVTILVNGASNSPLYIPVTLKVT